MLTCYAGANHCARTRSVMRGKQRVDENVRVEDDRSHVYKDSIYAIILANRRPSQRTGKDDGVRSANGKLAVAMAARFAALNGRKSLKSDFRVLTN